MLQFFPVGSVSDTIITNLESNVKKTNVVLSILSVLSKNWFKKFGAMKTASPTKDLHTI